MKRHVVDGAEILRDDAGRAGAGAGRRVRAPPARRRHRLPERRHARRRSTSARCCAASPTSTTRCDRSAHYQQAFPTDRILAVLKRNDGTQFDQHLVRRFVQLIGIYPVGNLVRLNTGEVAVVMNGVRAGSVSAARARADRSRRQADRPAVRDQPVGERARIRSAPRRSSRRSTRPTISSTRCS